MYNMLSKQIFDNWHVEKKDDDHLEQFMKRINIPKSREIFEDPESKTFRKSVTERLKKWQQDDIEEEFELIKEPIIISKSKGSCPCPCPCIKKSKKDDTETIWHRMECSTMESYYLIVSTSIENSLNCIRTLKGITKSLSYWDDPSPDWDGLSSIGGYMWLLSYALQHIIDDINPNSTPTEGLSQIRQKFQEIAQSGEIFSEMMEKFYQHVQRVREDAVITVNKLAHKWKLPDASNPFTKRPERPVYKQKIPKRRIGKGLADLEYEEQLYQENIFHLNWSPLTVMLRSKEIDWKPFGNLPPFEKIHWFLEFVQQVQNIMESSAEELTSLSGQISSINIEGDQEMKSQARELSGALLSFAKRAKAPSNSSPEETSKRINSLSEYWYSVDILQEESYKLLHLVHETRDIIRTCYVYMDTFYKWDMPSYDIFLSGKSRNTKGLHGSQTLSNMKEVWAKVINSPAILSNEKKLSDISEMLVMMDFSTSAYQRVVEIKPIEASEMLMKLESQTMELKDGVEKMGLVSGVDKRRSNK